MYESKNISFTDKKTGSKDYAKHIFVEPNSELGFHSPYIMLIPEKIDYHTMLVSPINPGPDAYKLKEARDLAKGKASKGTYVVKLAFDLKLPLLIPLFPDIIGYRIPSLTSFVYNNDVSMLRLINKHLSDKEIEEIRRISEDIPGQLLNMIVNAKEILKEIDVNVEEKVIIEGYSATGGFANSFTALYPKIIKACISGGSNGLGILPINKIDDTLLKFPLGTSDINGFNKKAFCKVPQLYYIGDADYNDPAMVKCDFIRDEIGKVLTDDEGYYIPVTDKDSKIIPILDKTGKLQPLYTEMYSNEEIEMIHSHFGVDPQERFDNQEKLYEKYGVNATFIKFPGGHKTILDRCNAPENVIKEFIIAVLAENNDVIVT